MRRELYFLIIFIIVLSCNQSNDKFIFEENAIGFKNCSELSLGELSYETQYDDMIDLMGEPGEIEKFDVGGWQVKKYLYENLTIELTDSFVYNIKCYHKQWETPSGIRVGLKKCQVKRILNISMRYLDYDSARWQFTCPNFYSLTLIFGADSKLRSIEIGIDLP